MGVDGGEPWIATERTHPLVFVSAFGGSAIAEAVWIYVGFTVFIPEYGVPDTVLLEVGGPALFAVMSVLSWTTFRPNAVRVSPEGVELRRSFGSVFKIPAEKVTLRERPSGGFGVVQYGSGFGYILSPNQFAAARRFFPVTNPATGVSPRPLS
ncbi:MAG TPA: hypothetical protein VGP88_04810 [Thermoplasmata archaeon]|jgi:hypothetical protein|nr:hypothetical protein [Thermoplasmata archaeon]